MRVIPDFGTPTRRAEYGGRAWLLHRGVPIDLPAPLAETLIRQGTATAAEDARTDPPDEADSRDPEED